MKTIHIHDLTFQLLISRHEIEKEVLRVAKEISHSYAGKELVILPILKGAFMFTADLVRHISVPQTLHFVTLSTYGDGTSSTGKVNHIQGLESLDLAGKHVLIVEDIVDSGFSISFLQKSLHTQKAASIEVATLMYKPKAFQGENLPRFKGFEIANDFVVGYGMDYAQRGRELPDVYVKVGEKEA